MSPEEHVDNFVDCYVVFVYYDRDFDTYLGQCPEIPIGVTQGCSVEEVLVSARRLILDKLLEIALTGGEPPYPAFHLIKVGKM